MSLYNKIKSVVASIKLGKRSGGTIREAEKYGIYSAVDIVCRGNKDRVTDYGMQDSIQVIRGYHLRWQNIYIEHIYGDASLGPGNGSVVITSLDRVKLYEASNYGEHVLVFRNGPWARRLLDACNEMVK